MGFTSDKSGKELLRNELFYINSIIVKSIFVFFPRNMYLFSFNNIKWR